MKSIYEVYLYRMDDDHMMMMWLMEVLKGISNIVTHVDIQQNRTSSRLVPREISHLNPFWVIIRKPLLLPIRKEQRYGQNTMLIDKKYIFVFHYFINIIIVFLTKRDKPDCLNVLLFLQTQSFSPQSNTFHYTLPPLPSEDNIYLSPDAKMRYLHI